MQEDCFRAIEAGATVVTASRRLARVLRQEFGFRQKARARSVWKTPDILPLDAFLGRAWREWVLSAANPSSPALLDTLQEQFVWEQVIRDSPEGDSLLRIPETAAQAMEAWQLVQAYRLPVDGRFEASDDWSAFAAWSRAFAKLCQANNWMERARISDFVGELSRSGAIPRWPLHYRAGFDDLTPQQVEFFEITGEWREIEMGSFTPKPQRWKFRDATEEIQSAASWARLQLERDPETQIGVIIPNLSSLLPKAERIFRETLHPSGKPHREWSFHLSLGPAQSEYPLVHAALLALEFALGPVTLPRVGMLLRSPFFGGAKAEWTKRALLDAKLRKNGVWDVSVSFLRDAAGNCPLLQRSLQRLEKGIEKLPAAQDPSAWSRDFSKLLEALGWPGDRVLNSHEHQVLEAWLGLLSSFAALDMTAAPMTFSQAFSRLKDIARETSFQVENEGAPVQVMGLLEASGLRFDHLWIMGLHDEALPAAASPNPFIPISMQREYGLPHASPERELTFAGKLIGRLLASAPEIMLSYPGTEGDRVLAPSPLLASGSWDGWDGVDGSNDWIAQMRAGVTIEQVIDENAPRVAADVMQPGGASLFKDMAACPFRAFAKHRLGARPLEETDLGLNYKDRGSTVHKALEFIWTELGSQSRLIELTEGELADLIARNVEAALNHLGVGIGRKVEQRRLQILLARWLEIEKTRAPFTVLKPEEERLVTLGGLQVRTRVDRIDSLNTGDELRTSGEIILDYKTGVVKSTGWDTDRPDEPQLPLYCATSARPIDGAAFAVIRTGELGFRGITENDAILPEIKKMSTQPGSFADQVAEWRRILERLAADYRSGLAVVDPKEGACEYCGLTALCRVREIENDRG